MTRLLVFLLVASSILLGMHLYIWTRLFRDPQWMPQAARVGALALALACVSLPLGAMGLRRLPEALRSPIAVILFTWLGVSFLLLVALAFFDGVRILARLGAWLATLWKDDHGPADPSRRLLIARTIAGAAVATASGAAGFAIRGARGEIQVREVPVKLERLPKSLEGLTIVQLSDIHVGLSIGKGFVESIVEKANAAKPDLIAITGDLVDGSVPQLAQAVAPLAALRARYGVFFVPGNHDHYSGVTEWLEHVRTLGMTTLVNERVSIGDRGPGGASIDLAGVDDFHGWPALQAALGGRVPDRELILLAHQPKAVEEASRSGVGLQLSGHTHGGQIWPFGALVLLQQPYIANLHRHGERTQIYVSRGTGYWGPPMRLGAPAEITKIVLT